METFGRLLLYLGNIVVTVGILVITVLLFYALVRMTRYTLIQARKPGRQGLTIGKIALIYGVTLVFWAVLGGVWFLFLRQ